MFHVRKSSLSILLFLGGLFLSAFGAQATDQSSEPDLCEIEAGTQALTEAQRHLLLNEVRIIDRKVSEILLHQLQYKADFHSSVLDFETRARVHNMQRRVQWGWKDKLTYASAGNGGSLPPQDPQGLWQERKEKLAQLSKVDPLAAINAELEGLQIQMMHIRALFRLDTSVWRSSELIYENQRIEWRARHSSRDFVPFVGTSALTVEQKQELAGQLQDLEGQERALLERLRVKAIGLGVG